MITKETEINITPMSMKNGVLGVSVRLEPVIKNWDAISSIEGTLTYANCTAAVCATPKKAKLMRVEDGSYQWRAPAWQFTVNNSIQFTQLRLDGVNTEIAGNVIGEKLVCEIDFFPVNGKQSFAIRVIEVKKQANNALSEKLRSLIKQQLFTKKKVDSGIHWDVPTKWLDISQVSECTNIYYALYMWEAESGDHNLRYLYVGIVGDVKNKDGMSKRTLAQRIREHREEYLKKGINLTRFRYDVLLKWPPDADPSEILKTSEMRGITALTAVIPCKYAQKQVSPLLPKCELVLLNKTTAYHSSSK